MTAAEGSRELPAAVSICWLAGFIDAVLAAADRMAWAHAEAEAIAYCAGNDPRLQPGRAPRPEPRPAPAWRRPPIDSGRYGEAALEAAIRAVAASAHGERNVSLNAAAYGLGRLVGAGRLDARRATDGLVAAGEAAGLPRGEVLSTVRSGLLAGVRNPLRAAER
jgi:hypothetical protein